MADHCILRWTLCQIVSKKKDICKLNAFDHESMHTQTLTINLNIEIEHRIVTLIRIDWNSK